MKLSWISLFPLIAITLIGFANDNRAADDPRSVAPHLVRPAMLSKARLPSGVTSDDLARQYEFLSGLPNAWVDYHPTGVVRQIWGEMGLLPDSGRDLKVGDSADGILSLLAPALLATGSESLRVTHMTRMLSGDLAIKTEQFVREIPVRYATVNLRVDPTGTIKTVTADFVPDRGLPATPEISATDAIASLLKELSADPRLKEVSEAPDVGEPTLAYAPGTSGRIDDSGRWARLVWCISFGRVTSREEAWVDAIDGTVVAVRPLTFSALNRNVYTAGNQNPTQQTLPGPMTLLVPQNGTYQDSVAQNAFINAAVVYQAFNSAFGRDSMDGSGNTINVAVHWGQSIANARYVRNQGQDYLFFGDGIPGRMPYGNNLDVVAHEFAHGVVRDENNFDDLPADEGGALKEAFADFGSTVADVYQRNGSVANGTWLIAEVFTADPTMSIRSWKAPAESLHTTQRDWYPTRRMTTAYEGAAYDNSTIMGHAFYLMTTGGTHYRAGSSGIPTINVPQIGYEKTRNIFYETLVSPELAVNARFPDLRVQTAATANTLYGQTEKDAVEKAWDAVGVPASCTSVPAAPQLVSELLCPHWRITMHTVTGGQIYNLQYAYTPSFAFPATMTDSDVQQCEITVSLWTYLRARACNVCGCSGWSQSAIAYPWIGECP